jgi:hypothetical protein
MMRTGTVLCGMPCSEGTARQMLCNPSPGSYGAEWIRARPTVPEADRVATYMTELPVAWARVTSLLDPLDVGAVPDATREDLAKALAEDDVVIVVAHHVQNNDLTSVGIEFSDGVIDLDRLAVIAPRRSTAVVDVLGVCRSAPLIPVLKNNCGSVRVLAREKTQVDPVARLTMLPDTVRMWRETEPDYATCVVRIHMAMLS